MRYTNHFAVPVRELKAGDTAWNAQVVATEVRMSGMILIELVDGCLIRDPDEVAPVQFAAGDLRANLPWKVYTNGHGGHHA